MIVRMWDHKVTFVDDHVDVFKVEDGVQSNKFHFLIEEDAFHGVWTKYYFEGANWLLLHM